MEALALPLASYTRSTITDVEALGRELTRVRERGYGIVIGELEEGFNAVAVPVRDALGDVAGAVSLGGSAARMSRRELTQLAERLLEALPLGVPPR
jgi:DNA-binding IclR family transcriptional regulator